MPTARGFASLALILVIVIGLAVLGGAGWYATRPVINPQMSQANPSAPTPVSTTVTAITSAYLKQHTLLLINEQKKIFTIRPDGTGKKLLTSSGDTPSWTPDGNIIFVSDRSGSPQVWIMDEDGSNPRQIGQISDSRIPTRIMPQEAKNGLIAFMGQGPGGEQDTSVWIMQKDGSGLKELVPHASIPYLALSGTWLTFTRQTENPYHRQIWRINTDGTGAQQLTFLGDPNYPDGNASAISPDETTIAFFSGKESAEGAGAATQSIFTFGYHNVAVIPAMGGARKTLTSCKPVTTQAQMDALGSSDCIVADDPAWTPDGKWIIFDQLPKNNPMTEMVDTNGQNKQEFFSTPRGNVRVPLKYVN